MAKNKTYDDDDGRTVVDMSEVDPMPVLLPRFRRRKDEPTSEHEMSKEDRRAVMLGAIGAVLLIGGIFIVAGAIVIFLMTKIWS
ncbi:MAG: hypothetical protein IJH52_03305 [Oscillospiraceae bacterium]|nr:hypothetical protein [Oscillospiraceae bacterium]